MASNFARRYNALPSLISDRSIKGVSELQVEESKVYARYLRDTLGFYHWVDNGIAPYISGRHTSRSLCEMGRLIARCFGDSGSSVGITCSALRRIIRRYRHDFRPCGRKGKHRCAVRRAATTTIRPNISPVRGYALRSITLYRKRTHRITSIAMFAPFCRSLSVRRLYLARFRLESDGGISSGAQGARIDVGCRHRVRKIIARNAPRGPMPSFLPQADESREIPLDETIASLRIAREPWSRKITNCMYR